MDFTKLLTTFDCECGKTHSCDIKYVIIEKGAINKICDITKQYKHILLVADNNTYAVCGDEVKKILSQKIENSIVLESKGFLVPNEESVAKIEKKLSDKTDLLVGIGSGVIQDLCKYVSFNHKLPYHIVATAPSMDGYASKGAAMIMGNMKVTYNAHVPEAIIGDTNILKDAPMDMIKSGYGDILGKFSCLNDWKLSHIVNDEYICPFVYNMVVEMLDKTKDLGAKLIARDEDAIKTLMEDLIGVGIAMAYVGNSRPASGSEHHLSHFFEIVGILKDEPYFMHGTDVVYSSVITQKLREQLLEIDAPQELYSFDEAKWSEKIKNIYLDASAGVIKLQKGLDLYKRHENNIYFDKWNEIKKVLKEAPTSQQMISYLESIELDINDFYNQYGNDKIQDAIWYAKDLKDRYTVLWLYYFVFGK